MIALLTLVLGPEPAPAEPQPEETTAEAPADEATQPAGEAAEDPPPTEPGAAAPQTKPPLSREPPPAVPEGMAAAGGHGQTPLPPPPPPEPLASVQSGAWRGRFWFEARVEITTPLGGKRPAKATVTSGGGAIAFGWRIRNFVGLYAAITNQIHDSATRLEVDIYGDSVRHRTLGRLTLFDFATGRFFLPVRGRFQPYLDVGGGGAVLASAADDDLDWGWQGRAAIGFDGWVGRYFTLGVSAAYRLLWVDDSLGHGLQAGFTMGAHW